MHNYKSIIEPAHTDQRKKDMRVVFVDMGVFVSFVDRGFVSFIDRRGESLSALLTGGSLSAV